MRYEIESQSSDELFHYGVLGMKWGVRRTPEELGHGKSSSEKKNSSGAKLQDVAAAQKKLTKKEQKEAVEAAKLAAKKAEEERIRNMTREQVLNSSSAKEIAAHKNVLSNQELQERLNRLNLEKQLNEYVQKENPAPEKKQHYFNGRKMVEEALQDAGKAVLTDASKWAFKQAFKMALSEEQYSEMFPSSKKKDDKSSDSSSKKEEKPKKENKGKE